MRRLRLSTDPERVQRWRTRVRSQRRFQV